MKKSDDDPCPLSGAVEILMPRWTSHILWMLTEHGTLRFSQLRDRLPKITPKVLTERLRRLERDGLVERRYHAEVPPRVEYTATPLAMSLQPTFRVLVDWSHQHRDEVASARERYDAVR